VSYRHGTLSAYRNHGCRCTRCTDAQAMSSRRNRLSRLSSGRLSHGSRSAYDAGCRCGQCRSARIEAYGRLASEYPQQRATEGIAA